MKFINATIYGFGKWVDYSIDFTKELAIIYGENESGKSTIQRFIVFMLFGLPPKQRSFYQPKDSGKMGGRLTVYDADIGEYTIERQDAVRNGAAICYTENGEEYDQAWLQERLSGMTLQTYQSIFSFSAIDLSAIKEMKEADLSDMLLSIGLTGSATIHNLEKQLESKMVELFRPTGKKPAINKQLEALDARMHALRSFQSNEETYRDKKIMIEQLTEQMEQLQTSLQDEKAKRYSIERQQQALPIINDYQKYVATFASYPEEITFPEKGIERLEKVKEAMLPLQSQQAVLEGNEMQHKQLLQQLEQERSEAIYQAAQEILADRESVLAYGKALEDTEANLQKLTAQIEAEINRLNIGITQEEVTQFSFPFHVENTWIELKNNVNQLIGEKEQLHLEEIQLKQERNYILNQLQMLEGERLSEERVHELQHIIHSHKENDLIQKLRTDSNIKRQEWQRTKKVRTKKMNHLLFVCVVLACLAAVTGVITDSVWPMYVMLTFLLIGGLQWGFRKYTMKEIEQLMNGESDSSESGQHTEEERVETEQLLSMHHNALREIESLEAKAKENEINRLKFANRRRAFEDKEARFRNRIEDEYVAYPFLRQVKIAYWPELFHSLKHLFNMVREYGQAEEKHIQLNDNLHKFEDEVDQFFAENNWEMKTNYTLRTKLEILESFIESEQEIARQMKQYYHILKENDEKQQEMLQKLATYEKEIEILFEVSGVKTEEAFYQKAAQRKEKAEIERLIERTINQLQLIFSKQAWKQYAEDNQDVHTLEVERVRTNERIKHIEQEIDTARKELAAIQASIAIMESSESYSDSIYHFEMEKEQLNKLAKEWSILKIAKEMLVETKQAYRNKYLPKVIEKTSLYFQELTGNTYRRVYAPNDDKPFQVEQESGIRFSIHELSQGTIDQLYVALRLATSLILSENHRLPFIIDDAFVHFDSVRTKRMMRIIEAIAAEQQVIVFTCKQEVVKASDVTTMIPLSKIS
ncbi:hypothetical protein CWR48_11370 [Oceanobacillus arenosus]|uniref:YhaN AAA domain-containing protein n=1 Tax=Oceanobacillus arenosus TaxID=1229153 RepID=A0A3D8PSC8_9BACI|nr:AAA family ATPase [Oceanobacillus arenosus]RDW18181.1 hypothetical protein CWR48_11370 [Oceanobacillus arenosus]